tara:strand:+ start:1650 stop:2057 length:408 start_codon:yes stop_codon:yes gene_type:complete
MEDPELEKIRQKQLDELMQQQNLNKVVDETPVLELTSNNFNQEILKNQLLLVDFWAEWCGPCKSMHPVFTRMAKKYKQVRFARVNVDDAQDIAMKYGVQSIPTFIMFKNGDIANRMVGAVGEPGIHMICKKILGN